MQLPGQLIRLRKSKGLSQLKLTEMMNVSRQAISRWEVGAAAPSTENLKSLGSLYNVPLEYLLNDDAPDPVHEDLNTGKERGQGVNIKRRSIALVLIAIGILAAILCAMFFHPLPIMSTTLIQNLFPCPTHSLLCLPLE